MKIRTGFVSNSSSSSFCIYGASFDTDELVTILKNIADVDTEGLEPYEIINKIEVNLTNLRCYTCPSDDGACIGRSWTDVNDDETGLQFKTSIQEELNKLIPNTKCNTIEESWYD